MEKKSAMNTSKQSSLVELDVGRRPEDSSTRGPAPSGVDFPSIPDPEVPEKAIRRKYPGEYKLGFSKKQRPAPFPANWEIYYAARDYILLI